MNVTTLGTWGAYPEAGEANSAFLVEEEGFFLLLDCGSGVLSKLQLYLPLAQLDAVLLSHYHNDHTADIGVLQYGMRIQIDLGQRKQQLPIYGHTYDSAAWNRLTYHNYTTARAIDPQSPFQLGPWQVSSCQVDHPVPCLALKLASPTGRNLLYVTDTQWCRQLPNFARPADLVICEASLYNNQTGKIPGHLSAGEAGKLAREAGARQLLLTHFPHNGNLQELISQAEESFPGTVHLAREGFLLQLNP